ncbi:hypothetical protein P153DRAFT_286995 [Dothidotthia symphoricarpi CBS 119687]|uniref:Uncharacterized protein n=1 Tax=Dothidotthia symphoricarpi CBS 119687 TaxID=1392245 RepID=A0A6A6AGI4_9PLEO|nr:uncharacterized protein P153DRAFT_286995 [Dothidotthia symphoricarpi CBS 119687]KAF2131102.1 hypothetical protein P153DRAFT_286995 [Dothidotthia symphoricarpi CBS 119687]
MPFEEHYRFDHSAVASPRQTYPDSPRQSSSSIPGTPRETSATFRPPVPKHDPATLDGPSRLRRSRSNSASSRSSLEGRRERSTRALAPPSLDKPLPSCPRSSPSSKYNDWYSLKGYRNFDICPTCYEGAFADTPFDIHFSQARLYDRPTERLCDFSSPWMRLAWLLTIKQRRQSLQLLYALADIADGERPCPGDREASSDRINWYGIPDQRDGIHVANFAICSCDVRMIEAIFPTMRGYFTRLPPSHQPTKSLCSLRIASRRFPKYLDLLVELDAEAQSLALRPNIARFIQLARDSAFKGECARDKAYLRKPWHFIPALPELTVCEECYDDVVWPAMQTQKSSLPRLFTKAIQLVPQEDTDVGSSCALYSPRMRRVWETSIREDDFMYLKRKAVERKRAEARLARERKGVVAWMAGVERGGREWERARAELREVEREWAVWE